MGDINTLLRDISTPTEERQPQILQIPEHIQEKQQETQAAEVIEEDKPELSEEAINSTVDIVVSLFDFTQTNTLTFLGNRKKKSKAKRLYGETALEKLEKLKNEVEAKEGNTMQQFPLREFTADDFGLLRLEKAVQEYLEGLPLQEHEIEALRVPLKQLIKKRGGTIPPEIALVLALMQITGARAAELVML